MAKFKAWSDDLDESEALEIEASDDNEAAELYAEKAWDDEAFESMTVLVRGSEMVSSFRISVDYSPNFYASAMPS